MLAVVEMIEKENQSYIRRGRKEGYEQAKKEFEEELSKIIKQKGKNIKVKEENKNMLAVVEMIEKENQSYIRRGRKEGYEQAKREFALLLLERNTPIEEISEILGLSITEIENIKKENDGKLDK